MINKALEKFDKFMNRQSDAFIAAWILLALITGIVLAVTAFVIAPWLVVFAIAAFVLYPIIVSQFKE